MTTAKDIRRHYVITCTALNVVYAALVVLISWVLDLQQMAYPLRVLAALLPAIPLIGVIYAFDRYLRREPDEFARFLLSRSATLAAGLVIWVLSTWGFLEYYAGVPRFPLLMVFPAFWGAFALISVFTLRSYA